MFDVVERREWRQLCELKLAVGETVLKTWGRKVGESEPAFYRRVGQTLALQWHTEALGLRMIEQAEIQEAAKKATPADWALHGAKVLAVLATLAVVAWMTARAVSYFMPINFLEW